MADRHFINRMPDFVNENPKLIEKEEEEEENNGAIEVPKEGTDESLLRLLLLPYTALAQRFQRAALDIKETVVIDTWGLSGQRVEDFTLYTGALGTVFLLFRSFQVTKNTNDLSLASEIVKACDSTSRQSRDVTFICGKAGVCALGAVIAKYMRDDRLVHQYITQFKEIKLSKDLPDELIYGRAGYLWSCLFLNKHLGNETISSTSIATVVKEIIKNGRKLGKKHQSPLMFEWDDERYWGAAHGLAGILHVLMHCELSSDELKDVKETLRYMIRNRFPSGNYPASEEDKRRDALVHWCHGAPGVALALVKAAEIFGDKEFRQAAMAAGEVVWNRGLLKRVGICHGICGNAYVFLSLYRLTGVEEYLYRAKAFACFVLDRAHLLMARGEMHGGDTVSSLFEGVGGMAHLFLDMVGPNTARFPGFEL